VGVEFDPIILDKKTATEKSVAITTYKEMQGIPVNKVVDNKTIIGKRGLRRKGTRWV
jgi:hypothetical protein